MTAALYDWPPQEHSQSTVGSLTLNKEEHLLFQEGKQRCPRGLSHSDSAEKVRDVVRAPQVLQVSFLLVMLAFDASIFGWPLSKIAADTNHTLDYEPFEWNSH